MAADGKAGYGKPPSHTQFRKGKSGNPRGRPKNAKNLMTDVLEELGERISVREGGKDKKVTKQRALVKTLANRGLKGDPKSTDLLLRRREAADERAEANRQEAVNSAEDDAIVERFLARIRSVS